MGEVSGGPSLTGWAGGVAEGPSVAFEVFPSTSLLAVPHPPMCTLICLPNSSVPPALVLINVLMVFALGFGTVYWEQIWGWERSTLLGKGPFSTFLLPVPTWFYFI